MIQFREHDEEKHARHHHANEKQHDAVNAGGEQAAGDVVHDAPERQQNEERANHADFERGALGLHS